jgi:hypothetical protein
MSSGSNQIINEEFRVGQQKENTIEERQTFTDFNEAPVQ